MSSLVSSPPFPDLSYFSKFLHSPEIMHWSCSSFTWHWFCSCAWHWFCSCALHISFSTRAPSHHLLITFSLPSHHLLITFSSLLQYESALFRCTKRYLNSHLSCAGTCTATCQVWVEKVWGMSCHGRRWGKKGMRCCEEDGKKFLWM